VLLVFTDPLYFMWMYNRLLSEMPTCRPCDLSRERGSEKSMIEIA